MSFHVYPDTLSAGSSLIQRNAPLALSMVSARLSKWEPQAPLSPDSPVLASTTPSLTSRESSSEAPVLCFCFFLSPNVGSQNTYSGFVITSVPFSLPNPKVFFQIIVNINIELFSKKGIIPWLRGFFWLYIYTHTHTST